MLAIAGWTDVAIMATLNTLASEWIGNNFTINLSTTLFQNWKGVSRVSVIDSSLSLLFTLWHMLGWDNLHLFSYKALSKYVEFGDIM